ncbi:GAF domain-containing protein [Streptomyces chartreusis]|uniref:GAF domain-containing protein n=1 Tax=Streptomyces chartreusis TaxID=1969 RepID=UPI0038279862
MLRQGKLRGGGVAEGEIDGFSTVPGSPFTTALTLGGPVLLSGDELHAALTELVPERAALARELEVHSWLLVAMFARGTALGTAVFVRFQTPRHFEVDDVLLATEFVARAAGGVDNAHRYGQERATAVALPCSLLPQRLPSPTAAETASRYLPASAHESGRQSGRRDPAVGCTRGADGGRCRGP